MPMPERIIHVEKPVQMGLLDAPVDIRFPAILVYSSADPYAVRLVFHNLKEPWLFSRELLAQGCINTDPHKTIGEGDVKIGTSTDNPDDVIINLNSPSGSASLVTRRRTLDAFTRDTYRSVSPVDASRLFDQQIDAFVHNPFDEKFF